MSISEKIKKNLYKIAGIIAAIVAGSLMISSQVKSIEGDPASASYGVSAYVFWSIYFVIQTILMWNKLYEKKEDVVDSHPLGGLVMKVVACLIFLIKFSSDMIDVNQANEFEKEIKASSGTLLLAASLIFAVSSTTIPSHAPIVNKKYNPVSAIGLCGSIVLLSNVVNARTQKKPDKSSNDEDPPKLVPANMPFAVIVGTFLLMIASIGRDVLDVRSALISKKFDESSSYPSK